MSKRSRSARIEQRLLGARLVAIRRLSVDELAGEAWPDSLLNVAIEFDNGDSIYGAADSEHNQQGCLVLRAHDKTPTTTTLYAHTGLPLRLSEK
jgi:hypothetical protein